MIIFNSFTVANDYNFGARCISEIACLISCEISLFVYYANREGTLPATYVSLASLARRDWR